MRSTTAQGQNGHPASAAAPPPKEPDNKAPGRVNARFVSSGKGALADSASLTELHDEDRPVTQPKEGFGPIDGKKPLESVGQQAGIYHAARTALTERLWAAQLAALESKLLVVRATRNEAYSNSLAVLMHNLFSTPIKPHRTPWNAMAYAGIGALALGVLGMIGLESLTIERLFANFGNGFMGDTFVQRVAAGTGVLIFMTVYLRWVASSYSLYGARTLKWIKTVAGLVGFVGVLWVLPQSLVGNQAVNPFGPAPAPSGFVVGKVWMLITTMYVVALGNTYLIDEARRLSHRITYQIVKRNPGWKTIKEDLDKADDDLANVIGLLQHGKMRLKQLAGVERQDFANKAMAEYLAKKNRAELHAKAAQATALASAAQ